MLYISRPGEPSATRAFFSCTWRPPLGRQREVRLKPDATYYVELETALVGAVASHGGGVGRPLRRGAPFRVHRDTHRSPHALIEPGVRIGSEHQQRVKLRQI